VDLSARFGSGATVLGKRTCIIILELPNEEAMQLVGLVVDAVDEVLDIDPEQIEPPPGLGTAIRSDFILGMARREQGFLIILKVDKLLDLHELLPSEEVMDVAMTG
ncbi:MAG: chemotaxis protein CheW, partial [Aeromonadaceae bacterium]